MFVLTALNFSPSSWRYSFLYSFSVVIAMEAIAVPHMLDSGTCERISLERRETAAYQRRKRVFARSGIRPE